MIIRIVLTLFFLIQNSLCFFPQVKNDIESQANFAVESFKWDIEKPAKGFIMFLDVPFKRENQRTLEYITLTVAKDKTKERPDFISIIVPNNILQSNGLIIAFTYRNISDKNAGILIHKERLIKIEFEKCNSQDCTARIVDCFAIDQETNNKYDTFNDFLTADQLLIILVYPDKSHKSIMIPLFSFRKQYNDLIEQKENTPNL